MGHLLTWGEVLLRLAPDTARLARATSFGAVYGGAEANVAASCVQLGHRARLLTRLPDSPLGDAALASLRAHDLDTAHVARGGARLGLYFLEHGAGVRPGRVVYDRADSAFATWSPTPNLETLMADVDTLHWTGITPALGPGVRDLTLQLLDAARQRNLRVTGDLNVRASLWRDRDPRDVLPDLVARTDVLITNPYHARVVLPDPPPDPQPDTAAQRLRDHYPNLQGVAFTLRPRPDAFSACWYWNGTLHTAPTHDLHPIVDRVGAGDAFAAGLLHGLWTSPHDPQRTIELAAAAGAWKHSVPGDANVLDPHELHTLTSHTTPPGHVVR